MFYIMDEVAEGQVISQSPVPEKPKEQPRNTMWFCMAIQAVIDGKKISRLDWDNPNIYGFLNGEVLSIHKDDDQNYQWVVSKADIQAKDWFVA